MKNCKPFLKWYKSSKAILPAIEKYFPSTIKKYCEPFLGGGATMFHILKNYEPEEVLANDINLPLIETYNLLLSHNSELIQNLKETSVFYEGLSPTEQKNIYNIFKESYNNLKSRNGKDYILQATLFIILNKICFGGMYRENKKGKFNTPFGNYQNPKIFDEKQLSDMRNYLEKVRFISGDYKNCETFIDKDTFVFLDPPHRPIAKGDFETYYNSKFNDFHFKQLKLFMDRIDDKGAKFLFVNSDPTQYRESDLFLDNLFEEYNVKRIKRINKNNKNERNIIVFN